MFSLILTGCKTEADLAPMLANVSAAQDRRYEIVLADPGGLPAAVTKLAKHYHMRVVDTGVSLAQQKNQAVQAATHDWLVFVPTGAVLQEGWQKAVNDFAGNPDHLQRVGIFAYRIESDSQKARKVESRTAFFNRTMGVTGGKQGVVLHRELFEACGGVDDGAAVEEVALIVKAKKLKRTKPVWLSDVLVSPAAPYEKYGYFTYAFRRVTAVYLQLLGAPRPFIESVLAGKLG